MASVFSNKFLAGIRFRSSGSIGGYKAGISIAAQTLVDFLGKQLGCLSGARGVLILEVTEPGRVHCFFGGG